MVVRSLVKYGITTGLNKCASVAVGGTAATVGKLGFCTGQEAGVVSGYLESEGVKHTLSFDDWKTGIGEGDATITIDSGRGSTEAVVALLNKYRLQCGITTRLNQSAGQSASRLTRRTIMNWSDSMKKALVVIVKGVLALRPSHDRGLPNARSGEEFWAKVASKMCDWVSQILATTHSTVGESSAILLCTISATPALPGCNLRRLCLHGMV